MTRQEKTFQAKKIQQWLKDNDYRFNKFVLGEYENRMDEWNDFLTQRQTKVDELNILVVEIRQEALEHKALRKQELLEALKEQERLDALKEPEVVEELTEIEILEDIIEDETT